MFFVALCYVRSLIFYIVFTFDVLAFLFFGWIASFFGDKICIKYIRWHLQNVNYILLRVIVGIKLEIRGLENVSKTHCIVASKHQSGFETLGVFDIIFGSISYVLKVELMKLPFAGKLLAINKSVKVDRKKGARSFVEMLDMGRKALNDKEDPRYIVIFPEGTRTSYGEYNEFKGGTAKMYEKLKVPLQPVALSTGFFWQSGRFVMYPGVAIVEVLPVIAANLNPDEVLKKAEDMILEASNRLAKENCPKILRKRYGL